MTKQLASVIAAAVATVALAACGGYDPTDAVNSSDELAPVNESAFQGQLDTISESEGVAVGKAAAN